MQHSQSNYALTNISVLSSSVERKLIKFSIFVILSQILPHANVSADYSIISDPGNNYDCGYLDSLLVKQQELQDEI